MRRLLLSLLLITTLADCKCDEDEPEPSCATESDCAGDEVCAELPDRRVCANTCGADNQCPEGNACIDTVASGLVCVPIVGDLPVGALCVDDTECASGMCFGPDDAGDYSCVTTCEAAFEDDGCAQGQLCYLADHRHACLTPTANQEQAGAACPFGPIQCESRFCVRVEATAEVGTCLDACDDSTPCAGPLLCVGLNDDDSVCVEPINDGETCTGPLRCVGGRCVTDVDGGNLCTRTCDSADVCVDGWQCVRAEGDDLCLPPLDSRAAGDDCESARECESGFCARFATADNDFGTLCADPCNNDGSCADTELIRWDVEPDPDLCGPFPVVP